MTSRPFEIAIVTRDSARWIGTFLRAYRAIGVEPLYLVDARSQDATAAILSRMGARTATITPAEARVESALSFLPGLVEAEWAVRIDDDEFPSRALLRWLDGALPTWPADALAISRRDSLVRNGELLYSRMPAFYFNAEAPDYLNPQWRVLRPRAMRFADTVHTPGFPIAGLMRSLAPPEAFFIHFDWVVRSLAERQAKLARYDAQEPGAGTNYSHFYLPELHPPEVLRLTAFETREFDDLARALVRPAG